MLRRLGIGIDIVNVHEFEKIPYHKKTKFYTKIFLPSEIKYCLRYKNSHLHFAGKFALKEAVIKAIKEPVPMIKIKTSHSKAKPTIQLTNKLQNNYKFIASLSHEQDLAVAVVISELLK
jgi:holo-[acyl-carrier protein] synthase